MVKKVSKRGRTRRLKKGMVEGSRNERRKNGERTRWKRKRKVEMETKEESKQERKKEW